MSLPKYQKYRHSGNEWLGQVPEHWEVMPCRAFMDEQATKNEGALNQNYLSLMANVGVLLYEDKGDIGNKKPEDLSKCKMVSKGDFVINSMNYGIGSYGLSPYDGVCSPVYIILRPRVRRVEPRYAFRIFENKSFQTYAQSFGNGILEHRAAINWDILKSINVGLPPLAEQQIILAFLDRETGKIDALIAEQEKLLALLAEKRLATISHAVTKGLNPDAPMKDSGVEWLGEVPEHWRVVPMRWYVTCNSGDGITSADVDPMLSAEKPIPAIGGNGLMGYVSTSNITCPVLAVGRVGALCGNVHKIVPPAWISDNALVLMPSEEFHLEYIELVLRSRNLNAISSKTAQPLITGTQLLDQRVPLPTKSEQVDVVSFVESETTKLDTLTTEATRAIELLKERRTALISAAVTGKIDVRSYQHPSLNSVSTQSPEHD